MFGYHCEDCDATETLRVFNGLILCLICRELRRGNGEVER